MKEEQFKTNIMCGSCISKVTPTLNENFGEGNWNVDTSNPKKVLTVSTDKENVSKVIDVLAKLGYKAESLN